MSDHPTQQQLQQWLGGGLTSEERQIIDSHLDTCSGTCVSILDWISKGEPPFPEAPNTDVAPPGYEILQEIGRGAMGVVYKARQVKLDRVVALKMILLGKHFDDNYLHRIEQEAKAVAALHHPNIVQIFETGEHAGLPFLALEYMEGGSLAAKVRENTLPSREAAAIVELLARGVNYAHSQGVLHRDLKPENVFLAWDGTPKIGDYGLAKRLANPGSKVGIETVAGDIVPGDPVNSELSLPGSIMGTPSYMAAEQARGDSKAIGAPADIYALGAILYRLTTGRPPFQAASVAETLHQVIHSDPVPLRRIQPNIPRDLETICLKCLDKQPAKRYASAEKLAEDLRNFIDGRPILARSAGPHTHVWKWAKRRPALATMATVSLIALCTLIGVWAGFTDRLSRRNWQINQQNVQIGQQNEQISRQRSEAVADKVDALVAAGNQFNEEGDYTAALPWFVQALENEERGEARQEMHRRRIGEVMARMPRMVRFWQHDAPAGPVEFSSDGRLVAAGYQDGAIRVYDLASGEIAKSLHRHKLPVTAVAFSPDGRLLATGSEDKTACVWDIATGNLLHHLMAHESVISQLIFARDGYRLLTCDDRQVFIWDLKTGARMISVRHDRDHPKTNFMHVSLSPNEEQFLTAGYDGTARIHDTETGKQLLLLPHQGEPLQRLRKNSSDKPIVYNEVWYAAFGPNEKRVATADLDGNGRIWDVSDQSAPKLVAELPHKAQINRIEFSPDGQFVFTAGCDNTIGLWHADTGALEQRWHIDSQPRRVCFSADGTRLAVVTGPVLVFNVNPQNSATKSRFSNLPPKWLRGPVDAISFHKDGRLLATGNADGTVRVFDLLGSNPDKSLSHGDQLTQTIAFSPNGDQLATGAYDSTARIWDVATGQQLHQLKHPKYQVNVIGFTPNGKGLITSCEDGTIRLWTTNSGEVLQSFPGSQIYASVSPDGRRLLASNKERLPCIWDVETSRPSAPLGDAREASALFSPDGNQIATFGQGEARIWDANTLKPIATLQKVENPQPNGIGCISLLCFSPDGKLVAVAYGGPWPVQVFDAANGKLMEELPQTASVHCLEFSPDSRQLATACDDSVAQVWKVESGERALPPLKHRACVNQLRFSHDGRLLATTSFDNTVRIWDAATGQPVSPPFRHEGIVDDICFSPDDRLLASASNDRTACIWTLHQENRPVEDLRLWSELRTGERLGAQGIARKLSARELNEIWQTLRQQYPQDFALPAESK